MTEGRWRTHLTTNAEEDLRRIAAWTREQFGEAQAELYRGIIFAAFSELQNGPGLLGVRHRDDLAPGLMALHVARRGRRGRHVIMFRVVQDEERMFAVLRILHDSMDLQRHLSLQEEPRDFD